MTAEQQIRSGQHRAGPGHDVTSRSGGHATSETLTEPVDQAGLLLTAYDFAGAYQLLIEVRWRIEHGVEVDHTDAVDAIRGLPAAVQAATTSFRLTGLDSRTAVLHRRGRRLRPGHARACP